MYWDPGPYVYRFDDVFVPLRNNAKRLRRRSNINIVLHRTCRLTQLLQRRFRSFLKDVEKTQCSATVNLVESWYHLPINAHKCAKDSGYFYFVLTLTASAIAVACATSLLLLSITASKDAVPKNPDSSDASLSFFCTIVTPAN